MTSFVYCVLFSLKANIVHNQPYDESVDVSDGEEVASTTATPRGGAGNEQHPAASVYIQREKLIFNCRVFLICSKERSCSCASYDIYQTGSQGER